MIYVLGDLEFSDESKAFIDKQVSNYLDLIRGSGETEYSRSKRSLREIETLSENYFVGKSENIFFNQITKNHL